MTVSYLLYNEDITFNLNLLLIYTIEKSKIHSKLTVNPVVQCSLLFYTTKKIERSRIFLKYTSPN